MDPIQSQEFFKCWQGRQKARVKIIQHSKDSTGPCWHWIEAGPKSQGMLVAYRSWEKQRIGLCSRASRKEHSPAGALTFVQLKSFQTSVYENRWFIHFALSTNFRIIFLTAATDNYSSNKCCANIFIHTGLESASGEMDALLCVGVRWADEVF
jgi:hypothetical protein